ncbi:MAG: flagellar basal body-associated FliL family protein [Pseudomonadota bacterium]
MAEDATAEGEEEPKKKGGLVPLLIGLVLALVGGGAGFGIVAAGLIGGSSEEAKEEDKPKFEPEQVAFVPLDPLIISVGSPGVSRHLRFQAQLEVKPGNEPIVSAVLPRVTDILNGYLRAVEVADIEDPAALVKLRAQMLRRVQIVVGDGLVSDLLVSEFVLN